MTLTGEGGIIPLNPIPQLLVILQCLIGIFSVFLLSVSLNELELERVDVRVQQAEVGSDIRPYCLHKHTLRVYRKFPATYPFLFIAFLQAVKFSFTRSMTACFQPRWGWMRGKYLS